MEQLIGAHTSIQGGVSKSVPLAEKLGFTAMQIFAKNNNRWQGKEITEQEAEQFKSGIKASPIEFVVVHDSYLINLCSDKEEVLKKSRAAFVDELERCELLEIPYLNFHPGSHGARSLEDGIKLIAESINMAHDKTKGFKVGSMLEATAGQGTAIGHRFEHLRQIIDLVDEKERMSVCIDTAHIFAAGYDIKDNYEAVMKEFDDIVGIDLLKCFHINDSKKALGTRVDRHEHIGEGFIGLKGFRNIMNDKRLERVPKILETPKGKEQLEDIVNMKKLISLIKKKKIYTMLFALL